MEIEQKSLRVQFQDFLKDLSLNLSENTSDVTIVCGDQRKIAAHKVILSSFSPLLRSILLDVPEGETMLWIEGVNYQDMELLLNFLYTGEGILSQTQVYDVLKVAHTLNIDKFYLDPNDEEVNNETSMNTKEIFEVNTGEVFVSDTTPQQSPFENVGPENNVEEVFYCTTSDQNQSHLENSQHPITNIHTINNTTIQATTLTTIKTTTYYTTTQPSHHYHYHLLISRLLSFSAC